MNFNNEQRQAIHSRKPLVVVSAGAGSGKTRVLTERFLYLCDQKLKARFGKAEAPEIGATVDDIVAITFTEKAAREMKDRVRKAINEKIVTLLNEYTDEQEREEAIAFWQEQKEALDGALISTFHSFCNKLLHEYAFQANIPPSFSLIDDVESKLLQGEVFDELLNDSVRHEQWKGLYQFFTKNQIQSGVISVYERTKEFHAGVDIDSFFSAKEIIEEQINRVGKRTEQMIADFLSYGKEAVQGFPPPDTCSGKLQEHLTNVIDFFESYNPVETEPSTAFKLLSDIMPKRIMGAWQDSAPAFHQFCSGKWSEVKGSGDTTTACSEDDKKQFEELLTAFVSILSSFHNRYDQIKRERAIVDFSDLQQKAIALLEQKEVQDACREKYLHMMIDEFQDTNQLQMLMLERINPHNRFIVGDGKQSIYRFRGADVRLMNQMEKEAKQASEAEFINMNKNYRTCDKILAFVNELFTVVMDKREAEAVDYKIGYNEIDSDRQYKEEDKALVELIVAEEAEEEVSEYDLIAKRMLEMKAKGAPLVEKDKGNWVEPQWSDMAILIPARTNLLNLERALTERSIPYTVYGGVGFYDRQEIRDFLSLLYWVNRPWEPLYIAALLRSPLIGVTVEQLIEVKHLLVEHETIADFIFEGRFHQEQVSAELKEKLEMMRVWFFRWVPFTTQQALIQSMEELFVESNLKLSLLMQKNNLQKVKNVEKLIALIDKLDSHSLEKALKKLKSIIELSDKEGEAKVELSGGDAVHIMTVHASKGLEFPIVFLPSLSRRTPSDGGSIRYDVEEKIVFKYSSDNEKDPLKEDKKQSPSYEQVKKRVDDEAYEESKRVFYVAATRARDYLVLLTKEKVVKKSWFEMLNKAIDSSSKMEQLLIINEGIEYDGVWKDDVREYESPTDNFHFEPSISFSVSEVMSFIKNPLDYFYHSIVKVDENLLGSNQVESVINDMTYERSTLDPSLLGTLVHRACELYDSGFGQEEAIEEALLLFEEENIEVEKYRTEIEVLMKPYFTLDQNSLGESIDNEWSFSTDIEGVTIIGEIDKVVKDEHGYHIIDFKTNKVFDENELISRYKPQLYLYKMAYEKEKNVTVKSMSLLFLRKQKEQLSLIEFEESYEQYVKEKLVEMGRLKRENAGKEEYERVRN
ncbi:UvrD-helicase domain-containing protein [Bacillus sp. FJAT-45350]|uniref:UvrD-helicase domain-containing protein n=1 Tax=Bacillus sp. FJAT-45350 TaxID=2011014 RepID=UPI00211BED72|nr:UvrD-helicase domain-containing protein [Bacillus sp. FJAT-45350]